MAHAATDTARPFEAGSTGTRALAAGGAIAGLAGGVVMIVTVAIGGALAGEDAVAQLRAVGLTFLGDGAVDAGAALLAWGLLLHLLVSMALGIVFTWLLPSGFPAAGAAVAGMGYAWVVMGITTSAFLPAVNPVLRAEMTAIGGTWVIAHALYGMALGAGPRLRQRLADR